MKQARHGHQGHYESVREDEKAVQAKLVPGKRTLSEHWPVQRSVAVGRAAPAGPDAVHAAADHATSGAAGPLPHLATIQQLFGRHDVTRVQAHTDARASEGASAMGAQAFARGDRVAFAGAPDLHTAAHEAAHVVQQRAGVHLKGGVGAEGDAYEQHADAVADAVVAGRSAEPLLSAFAAPSSAAGPAVQQRVKARKMGTQETKEYATLDALCAALGVQVADLVEPFKTCMFKDGRFPDAYKDNYATVSAVKAEVRTIVEGLDDLVAAAASQNVIVASSAEETAKQLFGILDAQITQARLDGYPYCQRTRALGDRGVRYMGLLATAKAKLTAYRGQIHEDHYDLESQKTNALMQNRVTLLTARCTTLHDNLTQEMAGANRPLEVTRLLDAITAFVAEVDDLEHAWDLDHKLEADGVNDDVATLAQNPHVGDHFQPDGGEDDGMAVGQAYQPMLACSLFSILALKPGWLGADSPATLHRILRKTQNLQQYDDNAVVAKVRYLAGLAPTVVAGAPRLDNYVTGKTQRGERDSFIVDITGAAHTFAAVFKNGAYRKVDETGANGNLGDYAGNTVIAIWQ